MAEFRKSGAKEPFLWNCAAAARRNRKAVSSADIMIVFPEKPVKAPLVTIFPCISGGGEVFLPLPSANSQRAPRMAGLFVFSFDTDLK